jgi:hypothetical protein
MPPTAPVGRSIRVRRSTPPLRASLAELCAEARRLAHRRCRAEAAVRRLRAHPAHERVGRLAAHSDRLLVGLHRTLDRIRAAEGYEEALELFREYRAELARRLAGAPGLPVAGEPSRSTPGQDARTARQPGRAPISVASTAAAAGEGLGSLPPASRRDARSRVTTP